MAARIAARPQAKESTKRPRRKTTAVTTGRQPHKIPQPHGGALNSGGTPGNAGGLGRPASDIKARLRGSFYDRIPLLEQIADACVPIREQCPQCKYLAPDEVLVVRTADADRLRALDMMAKYAGDEDDVPASEVRKRLEQTIATIRATVEQSTANVLIAALGPVWA